MQESESLSPEIESNHEILNTHVGDTRTSKHCAIMSRMPPTGESHTALCPELEIMEWARREIYESRASKGVGAQWKKRVPGGGTGRGWY